MSRHPGTTLSKSSRRMKKDNSKKVYKLITLGFSMFQKMIFDSIDEHSVILFTEMTKCRLCSLFLVMTTRKSCCVPCLADWMKKDDPDDEIIKCRKCNTPIKAALTNEAGLKEFYMLIEFKDKKIKPDGHFSYPVLDKVAMDHLFAEFERNPDLPVDWIHV